MYLFICLHFKFELMRQLRNDQKIFKKLKNSVVPLAHTSVHV